MSSEFNIPHFAESIARSRGHVNAHVNARFKPQPKIIATANITTWTYLHFYLHNIIWWGFSVMSNASKGKDSGIFFVYSLSRKRMKIKNIFDKIWFFVVQMSSYAPNISLSFRYRKRQKWTRKKNI